MNMIMDPIFRRIDETIGNATRGASRFTIVFVLALFALGFAAAAAHAYAMATWGQIAGNLVIAGAFLVAAIVVHVATTNWRENVIEPPASTPALDSTGPSALSFADQLLNSNGDIIKSIESYAPVAAKAVVERVGPHLHLIMGAALGVLAASKLAEKLDRTKPPEA